MSLKIFGRTGESPYPSSVSLLVRAYAYAKQMRDLWISSGGTKGANIRVLNNSIGGYGRSQTEFDAVQALNDSGVLFVAAAGNYTRNNDVFPIYPAGYESPNVISVAATSINADYLTNFTNVGARSVTMSAPGQTIQSTTAFGNYATYDGTSMASPFVAGAAALICAAYPNITLDKLRSALIYNGDLVASQNYKTLTSRRLNVFSSLKAVAENDTTPPAAITDFRIVAQNGRSVTLGWTAPGDDGHAGTASLYDIRYSTTDLSAPQQFDSATSISPLGIPIPSPAGTFESAVVELPFQHTGGFVGLRAIDNMGNTSPVAVVPLSIDNNAPGQYDVTESAPQSLSTGGTQLQGFGIAYPDDGYSMDYRLPFAFPYFGSWVRNVTVSTNGAIYFSTPPKFLLPPMTGQSAPLDAYSSIRGLQTNAMIAGMWDDLYITGGVYTVTPDANRIIFRWEGTTFDTPFPDGTSRGKNPIKFEIEIRRDGTIQLRYGDGNQKLFPVVGISGGGPDAYVINSHTSENVLMDLTNANTVTFAPHFTPAPTSADMQIVLKDPSVVTPRAAGGNIYRAVPQAAVPGQVLQYSVNVTDLGPDAADNVVITAQLASGLSFVECGLNVTCTGPPAGSNGGTVTTNVATIGQLYLNRASGTAFSVRVNAAAGTTLSTTFNVSSSTLDLNLANNTVTQTTLVADYSPFSGVLAVDGPLALRTDGTVWYWGYEFGSSNCEGCDLIIPKQQSGLSNVSAISRGMNHALALRSDGTVWSWGRNDYGQLGNQPLTVNPSIAYPPTQISGLPNIQLIAAGPFSSFAVDMDGTVWEWGDNTYGELGDGTKTSQLTPTKLTAVAQVRSISSNGNCTYALKRDGTVWSWGSNTAGILGNGSTVFESLFPVQVTGLSNIRSVKTRFIHALAVRDDGTVWAWGSGSSGQLGNGSNNDSNVPVRVNDLTNVTAIDAGDLTCVALKTDGTVWTWGGTQGVITPRQVAGLSGVTAINAVINGAILADGTLMIWGNGSSPAPMNWLMVASPPVFTPGGNVYVFPKTVTIDCETIGAAIHYTTNGVDPNENDPIIASGATATIDRTSVLKARAWKSGWTPSKVTTDTFTILVTPPPMIFLEDGTTNQAVALDSVTFVRGPFHVLTDHNFSADHHTRVILFTSNLGLSQSDSSLVTVQAAGFPLTVENVGSVSGVPGLDASFIVVRLPDGLPAGDLPLTITVRGVVSRNSPIISILP